MKARLAEVFATKTRDEWCEILEGTDACTAPVLTYNEARAYQHNVDRETFSGADGTEVVPIPRLSRTPGQMRPSPAWIGADTDDVLAAAGFNLAEISQLRSQSAVGG